MSKQAIQQLKTALSTAAGVETLEITIQPVKGWVIFTFANSTDMMKVFAWFNKLGGVQKNYDSRFPDSLGFGKVEFAQLCRSLFGQSCDPNVVYQALLAPDLAPDEQLSRASVALEPQLPPQQSQLPVQAEQRTEQQRREDRRLFCDMSQGSFASAVVTSRPEFSTAFWGNVDVRNVPQLCTNYAGIARFSSSSVIDFLDIGRQMNVELGNFSELCFPPPFAPSYYPAPQNILFEQCKIQDFVCPQVHSGFGSQAVSASDMVVVAANPHHAGGGVCSVSGTQEEAFFRCSDVAWRIPRGGYCSVAGQQQSFGKYPVNLHALGPYFVTNVIILNQDFSLSGSSIGAAAFLVAPDLRIDKNWASILQQINVRTPLDYVNYLVAQYRIMYEYAKNKGMTRVINTFLGAGVFNNNRSLVAMIAVLVAKEYAGNDNNIQTVFVSPDDKIMQVAQQCHQRTQEELRGYIQNIVKTGNMSMIFEIVPPDVTSAVAPSLYLSIPPPYSVAAAAAPQVSLVSSTFFGGIPSLRQTSVARWFDVASSLAGDLMGTRAKLLSSDKTFISAAKQKVCIAFPTKADQIITIDDAFLSEFRQQRYGEKYDELSKKFMLNMFNVDADVFANTTRDGGDQIKKFAERLLHWVNHLSSGEFAENCRIFLRLLDSARDLQRDDLYKTYQGILSRFMFEIKDNSGYKTILESLKAKESGQCSLLDCFQKFLPSEKSTGDERPQTCSLM